MFFRGFLIAAAASMGILLCVTTASVADDAIPQMDGCVNTTTPALNGHEPRDSKELELAQLIESADIVLCRAGIDQKRAKYFSDQVSLLKEQGDKLALYRAFNSLKISTNVMQAELEAHKQLMTRLCDKALEYFPNEPTYRQRCSDQNKP